MLDKIVMGILLAGMAAFPGYREDQLIGKTQFHNHKAEPIGIVKSYDRNADGKVDLNVAFLKCGINYFRFGAYDFFNNTLYLDKNNDDVPEIVGKTEEMILIRDYAPSCKYEM